MARMALSATSFWRWVSILLASALISQWIMFSLVLSHQQDPSTFISETNLDAKVASSGASASAMGQRHIQDSMDTDSQSVATEWDGVGVTLMWFAPKWFHRRYTFMVQNAMANLPSTWAIQLVINAPWMERDVFPLHSGLQTLLRSTTYSNETHYNYQPRPGARLLWTPLPPEFTAKPRKQTRPKDIMKSTIFWNSLVAEHVVMFSGNGAFCANGGEAAGGGSGNAWDALKVYDYVGTPWNQYHGKGGDGETHSVRKKSTMLSILEAHPPKDEKDDLPDHRYFAKYLLQNDSGNDDKYKVADAATTQVLGGIAPDKAPLVVSGTQSQLDFAARENLLFVCPEVKVIFPSLQ